MTKTIKCFYKYLLLWIIGGSIYFDIELIWRGKSHWSMFVLGGICFVYAGSKGKRPWPLWQQVIQVDLFALTMEFITGCIVNLELGWNVWNYSHLPFNILGQTCPQFALLFLPLCFIGIILSDYLQYWLFHEEKPPYMVLLN